MHKVEFISLEENEKDLIVSFAIEDPLLGVKSLILHRTLFFEEFLGEEERGVIVSMEGITIEQEHLNVLKQINIKPDEIEITSVFNVYRVDTSRIEAKNIGEMINLIKRQNYDNRFIIHVAHNTIACSRARQSRAADAGVMRHEN